MNIFKFLLCLCLCTSISFGSIFNFSKDSQYVTLKELKKNGPSAIEIYVSLLKLEIMRAAQKKHKKETFALALKLNHEIKQVLEEELTPNITQETLDQLKNEWKISASKDQKLLAKTLFRSNNASLFHAPKNKKDIFWIADYMKFPIYDIARSSQFSAETKQKQFMSSPVLSYNNILQDRKEQTENALLAKYNTNFTTLSQIATVMYNRNSFMDEFFVMYLSFLYTVVNQFPIFLSIIIILWLTPLVNKLNGSGDTTVAIKFNRFIINMLFAILGLIVIIFSLMALGDIMRVLVTIFVGIILAPLLLFSFLFGLSFSTDSFIFFEDSSIGVIITEIIRYKLIEMGLDIELNHELLWFCIKLFVLLVTSNKIYFAISMIANYFSGIRRYKHFFATGGVFSLFIIMYISDSKHLVALFEICKRYFV